MRQILQVESSHLPSASSQHDRWPKKRCAAPSDLSSTPNAAAMTIWQQPSLVFPDFFHESACPAFQPTVEPAPYGGVDCNPGSVVHGRRSRSEQPTKQPSHFGNLRRHRCDCNYRSVCGNDSRHRYETNQQRFSSGNDRAGPPASSIGQRSGGANQVGSGVCGMSGCGIQLQTPRHEITHGGLISIKARQIERRNLPSLHR
jgi:hypothetical protein